jgi:hypothetical protein
MLFVVGRKDIEPEWGEALGHLCTQRIEMAVRRVIGMYSLFRVRVSEISARGLPVASLEPSSRCLAQAAQPHASDPWVSPVTFTESGRGASTDIHDNLRS